jgi:hypothetical protein
MNLDKSVQKLSHPEVKINKFLCMITDTQIVYNSRMQNMLLKSDYNQDK